MSADPAEARPVPLVVVAAVARNDVIGDGLAIPWRLSTDLKRFRRLTVGRPVIMGRRTFDSIGRPLPERTTIVVTRDPNVRPAGASVVDSPDAALAAARAALEAAPPPAGTPAEIAVAGGAAIYDWALPRADRLELTRVDAEPAGDVRFPPVDWARFRLVARASHPAGPRDDHPFVFETWERVAAGA